MDNPDIEVGARPSPPRPTTKKRRASATRAESMRGNQNAATETPERSVISLSLSGRRRELLRNAIAWHEGYIPEDDEVDDKARVIAYAAWDAFVRAIERDNEDAMFL